MKKHLNFFWLKNLQNKVNSNNKKTLYYLSGEILTSYDKVIVKTYLESVAKNIPLFKKTKSVIVIPDILALFSLDSTFDYNKTITRYQLNQEIIKLTKTAKQEKIAIFQEINIAKLHSYRKAIDEMFNQKNLEEKNLTDNQSFLSRPIQFKRKPKLYDFLDTETFNLSNYSDKADSFQSELELLVEYFENEYGTEGIIFNSVNKITNSNEIDKEKEKILNLKTSLEKITKEKDFSFLAIYTYQFNNRVIKKVIENNIFEKIIIKFDDYSFSNPNKFFNLIEKWNPHNVLLWVNPNLININFENIAKTSFYHFDLYFLIITWLILSKKSFFITWPFFQEIIDGFETNSFKILENKYGYEQKFFLNNTKTEDLIIKIFRSSFDLFLDIDLAILNSNTINKSFLNYFTSVKKYTILTDNNVFKIVFNLTSKKHNLKVFKNYSIVFTSSNYQEKFIKPYQFIIFKKK